LYNIKQGEVNKCDNLYNGNDGELSKDELKTFRWLNLININLAGIVSRMDVVMKRDV
jgi:hypothetical protein